MQYARRHKRAWLQVGENRTQVGSGVRRSSTLSSGQSRDTPTMPKYSPVRSSVSAGRSPRCSVLSSGRASTFGGFPCKAGSESSTAGLFVGYRTQSGEYMVANSEGAYKTRTMMRILETEHWDKSGIEGMPWTPWKFKARGGAGSPGEADCAGPDSFLDIEIDKSIRSFHHAGGAKPVWHSRRLCGSAAAGSGKR